MNWMGAIMSASGFTWCYLVVVVLFGLLVDPFSGYSPGPNGSQVT